MQKRGELSKIGIILLIGSLIIILAIVLWFVIRGEKGNQEVFDDSTLDLKISQVQKIDDSTLNITVKRNEGEGEFVALSFVVEDGALMELIRKNVSMPEMQEGNFSLNFVLLNASKVKKISVTPIYINQSGKEVIGNIKDEYIIPTTCSNYCPPLSQCGFSNCGAACGRGCSSGYLCLNYKCVKESSGGGGGSSSSDDDTLPICTDTCSSLVYQCGIQNICGNTIVCGNCSTGTCNSTGQCVVSAPAWQTGMVSWWRFNGNASDSKGTNHGIVNGATLTSTGCKSGQCYSFDGSNDFVSVPDSSSLDITNMIALGAWIKLDTFTSSGKIIVKPIATGADPWEFYTLDVESNGTVRFILSNGSLYSRGGWNSVLSGSSITLNEWYHILGTYDGSSMKIYVNGSLSGTKTVTLSIATSNQNLLIGKYISGNYIDGTIDEVMIFNRSLSATEVQQIYNYNWDGDECSSGAITSCTNNDRCCSSGCNIGNDNDCLTCTANSQCDDGNACTTNICSRNVCTYSTISNCCTSSSQCNDNNVCTTDMCSNNVCQNIPATNCCTSSSQCNDNNICTTNTCSNNICSYSQISNCCTLNSDCNDNNVCTTNTCSNNVCLYPPISNCCTSSSQCNDNSICTTDICSNNVCQNIPATNCCTSSSQCNDNNICTTNTCSNNICSYPPISNCCTSSSQCEDNDPCTTDSCSNNQCANIRRTSCAHNDSCCPVGCNFINDNNCRPVCPNGYREGTEQCDGNDFGGTTCSGVLGIAGYTGTLKCSNCMFNTSLCVAPCTQTCASLGYQCGSRTICGSSVNCGSCTTGQTCTNNVCVNVSSLPSIVINESYTIVVARQATEAESFAATELADFIEQSSGVSLSVVSENLFSGSRAIYLGQTNFAQSQGIDFASLNDEEWILKVVGQNLIISGGRPRGTIYGVYEFLEQIVGIKFLTPDSTYIPSQGLVKVQSNLSIQENPAFTQREIFMYTGGLGSNQQALFQTRRKINSFGNAWTLNSPQLGYSMKFGSPYSIHTFSYYTQGLPSEYIQNGQVCISDPYVQAHFITKLRQYIESDRAKIIAAGSGQPFPRIYAIVPNDDSNKCTCAECTALIGQYGSYSGVLLDLINKIADNISADYPDIYIMTFAYTYYIDPPSGISPRDNVIIRIAQLGSEFAANPPRDTLRSILHPVNQDALEIIQDWSDISSSLGVHDYWTAWNQLYLWPHTDVHGLAETLKTYNSQHIKYFFVEDYIFGSRIHNFMDLQFYLASRLLQNPDQDTEIIINEFMESHYGAAAPAMRQFLDYLESRQEEESGMLCSVSPWKRTYFDPEFFIETDAILTEAENAVRGDQRRVRDIQLERLAIDETMLYMWSDLSTYPGWPFNHDAVLARLEANYNSAYIKSDSRSSVTQDQERLVFLDNMPSVPTQFAGKKVIDLVVPFLYLGSGSVAILVNDSDAIYGNAWQLNSNMSGIAGNHTILPRFGLYQAQPYFLHTEEIARANIPTDRKYHWYWVGQMQPSRSMYFWAHGSWWLSAKIAYPYNSGLAVQKPYDVWVSLKLKGPNYVPGTSGVNSFSIDRIILVESNS